MSDDPYFDPMPRGRGYHSEGAQAAREQRMGRGQVSGASSCGGCLVLAVVAGALVVGAVFALFGVGSVDPTESSQPEYRPDFAWSGVLTCRGESVVGFVLTFDLVRDADAGGAVVRGSIDYLDGRPGSGEAAELGSSQLAGRASGGEVVLFARPAPGDDAEPHEIRSLSGSFDVFAPDVIRAEIDANGCTALEGRAL